MLRIRDRDRDAFTYFCYRHAGRCLGVARQVLIDRAEAEDVVQEAFLRVWQTAPRWQEGEARVTSWLYRVVLNLALDAKRRAGSRSLPLDQAAEIPAADPSPEAIVGGRELATLMHKAVEALPERQRTALNLVISQGLDCAEAARVMRVSVGTMESLLVRGRRRLRAVMAEAMRAEEPPRPQKFFILAQEKGPAPV